MNDIQSLNNLLKELILTLKKDQLTKQLEKKDGVGEYSSINDLLLDGKMSTHSSFKKLNTELDKLSKKQKILGELQAKYNPFKAIEHSYKKMEHAIRKEQSERLKTLDSTIKGKITAWTDAILRGSKDRIKYENDLQKTLKEYNNLINELKNSKEFLNDPSKKTNLIDKISKVLNTQTDKNSPISKQLKTTLGKLSTNNGNVNTKSIEKLIDTLEKTTHRSERSIENMAHWLKMHAYNKHEISKSTTKNIGNIVAAALPAIVSGSSARLRSGMGFGESAEAFGKSTIFDNISTGAINQFYTNADDEIRGFTGGSKQQFVSQFDDMADSMKKLGFQGDELPKAILDMIRPMFNMGLSGRDSTAIETDKMVEFSRNLRDQYGVTTEKFVEMMDEVTKSGDFLVKINKLDVRGTSERAKAIKEEMNARVKLAKSLGMDPSTFIKGENKAFSSLESTYQRNIRSGVAIDMFNSALQERGLGQYSLSDAEKSAIRKEQTFGQAALSKEDLEAYKYAIRKLGLASQLLAADQAANSMDEGGNITNLNTMLPLAYEQFQQSGIDLKDFQSPVQKMISRYGDMLFNGKKLSDYSFEEQSKILLGLPQDQFDKLSEVISKSDASEMQQEIDKAVLTITGPVSFASSALGGIVKDVFGMVTSGIVSAFITNKMFGGVGGGGGKIKLPSMFSKLGMYGNTALEAGKAGLKKAPKGKLALGAGILAAISALTYAIMHDDNTSSIENTNTDNNNSNNSSAASLTDSILDGVSTTASLASFMAPLTKISSTGVTGALGGAGKIAGKALSPLAALGSAWKIYHTDTSEYDKRLKGNILHDFIRGDESDDWEVTRLLKDLQVRQMGAMGQLADDFLLGIPSYLKMGMWDDTKLLDVKLNDEFLSQYADVIDEDIANQVNAANATGKFIDPATGQYNPLLAQEEIIKILKDTKDIHEQRSRDDKEYQNLDIETKNRKEIIQRAINDDTEKALSGLNTNWH